MDSTEKSTDKRLLNLKEPWRKGQTGNPRGKQKGQRDFRTIYAEALRKIGESQNMTPEEVEDVLHRSGLAKAMKGDYAFYRDTLDRLHGKPVQKEQHSGAVQITIKRL